MKYPTYNLVADALLTREPSIQFSPGPYDSRDAAVIIGLPAAHEQCNAYLFILRVSKREPVSRMRLQAKTTHMHGHSGATYEGKTYARTEYVTSRRLYRVMAWDRTSDVFACLDTVESRKAAQQRLVELAASPMNMSGIEWFSI